MEDWRSYNHETKIARAERHQRAREITDGERGPDHLTAKEYALLTTLRKQGIEITAGWLINRDGAAFLHPRIVEMERSACHH